MADRDGTPGIEEIEMAVTAWRNLGLLVHQVIHGRSNDWPGLRLARVVAATQPVVGQDSLCRDLIVLCERIAVENDWRTLYGEIDEHCRRLFARLEQVELGLDILRGLLAQSGEVAA
jgi:hypothetical protein